MLTLYHSPMSRSSRIVTLVTELGAQDAVDIRTVSVRRFDGTSAADPANPHPEGKVPALVQDGTLICESIAIAQHLCDLFPDAGLMPAPGTPARAECLQWLAWYAGVVEPVVVAKITGIDEPAFRSTFRGWDEVISRLGTALDGQDYLVGNSYGVADLLVQSIFNWMPDLLPDHAGIRDWNTRVSSRPAAQQTVQRDLAAKQTA